MSDMLVNLLAIDDYQADCNLLKEENINIFRALAPDKIRIIEWVKKNSSVNAAGECDVCFSKQPVSCFIAAKGSQIIGYACYNAIAPDFFGPTRVSDEFKGKGIGKALLLRCLNAMKEEGYIYAIIGGVGPVEFYEKCAHAVRIESSESHSVYDNFLAGIERAENSN